MSNDEDAEQLENGSAEQRLRRRSRPAFASRRTTPLEFSHSHAVGLAGSQHSPKTRGESFSRTTPNDQNDYRDDSENCAQSAATRGIRTAWELADLLRPLPCRRQPRKRRRAVLTHFPELVKYAHENRYACVSHFQRRFSATMPSIRTAQDQLAGLVQLGYLARAPVRSISPNFPFVFHATSKGRRWLVDQGLLPHNQPSSATEHTRSHSRDFLAHELAITEFDLAVWQTVKKMPHLQRLFVERRYFRPEHQLPYYANGRRLRLIPDSGFMLKIAASARDSRNGTLLMHFTEIDRGTMSLNRIRQKYQRYASWSRSESGVCYLRNLYSHFGAQYARPSFRLLVVVCATSPAADEKRLVDVFAEFLKLQSDLRKRVWITTATQLRAHQNDNPPLRAPIWLSPRDWQPESLRGVLPTARRQQRDYVLRHLSRQRQRCLFPDHA